MAVKKPEVQRRITIARQADGRDTRKKRPDDKRKGNNPMGRPQAYSDMIGAYICRELQLGRTITSICTEDRVPSLPTVYNWLNRLHPMFNETFFKSYYEARKIQAETLADETKDIADGPSTKEFKSKFFDNKGKATGSSIVEKDITAAKSLRIDTRKWIAKCLAPNKFSEKMQLTGNDGDPLIPTKTKIVVNFIRPNKPEENKTEENKE